ncbi:MAG: LamG domain-containing protein [Lentisphaerae bacterium]|nr:LamG domain-containing protein [Lentisphaerota bacterium]MBT4816022.1 LamG domain-containing protein [Lentisphaerota bacterium]MBT5604663.1 LamG domain-containing protein [Lentisphaerota bacterium]MBT7060816.1 LamG domain-containing protein [Lentisphaerota bacterium]MBT7843062.1 LamG domain-containing protein [Lentisphaerota bacterium]
MRHRLAVGLWALAAFLLHGQSPENEGLLFHLPFDGSANAVIAKGRRTPLTAEGVTFVPGILGQAVRIPLKGILAYATEGNLSPERGTLSFWVQRPQLSAEELIALRTTWRARQLFGVKVKNGGMVNVRLGFADFLVLELGGRKLTSSVYGTWAAGTWHHVAVTWDKDDVTCLYLDGQFLAQGRETLGGLRYRCPFEPESVPEMYVGCLGEGRQSDLPIDEMKLYNRVLSTEEISQVVRQAAPLHVQILPQILAQGANSVTVTILNQGAAPVKGDQIAWELRDTGHTSIAQGRFESVPLVPGWEKMFTLGVQTSLPGEYALVLRPGPGCGPVQEIPLYVSGPMRLGKRERLPNPELELVDQIDCGRTLPPERFMERGKSRIVASPLGDYCEAAHEKWSRLVYTVNIEAVQEPHLVTIRYPDDRARCAYVMVRGKEKKNRYSLHAGYSVGAEFPNTGELQSARYLWWPMEKRNALMLCSWWEDQPAAVRDITVEQIVGGISGIPALQVSEPKEEPGRPLAIEWEDASLASNFGFDLEPALTLRRFETLTDRLIAYMGFTGMDTLVYPATFYFGPMCRHPRTTGLGNRLQLHPEGWLELLMARFSAAGLDCYPALNFHSTSPLVAGNVDDPIRIQEGADTFFQVPCDGVVPRFSRGDSTLNPLHPKVQHQTLEMIDAIVKRCEGRTAYAGIQLCFWPYRQIPFCFTSIRHGYGDTTIQQFTEDTGITCPVSAPDPGRFYERYRFLLENHRREWVTWRCRKIADYVAEAAVIARRRNTDARILVPLLQEAWPDEFPFYRKLLRGRSTCETEWRERGVDLRLLAEIPGVRIQRQTRDAYRRYKHRPEAKSSRDNASSWEVSRPFREIPSGAFPFNHYYEHRWNEVPVPGAWWQDEWSAGTANGGGRYYLERSAWSMFLQDAQSLCRGACSVEAQASIWESREFARAYRPLPEKPFQPWTRTVIEPAAVREYAGKAGRYIYAVNAMYCPLDVSIKLSQDSEVTELSTGRRISPVDGVLTLPLKPYELRSFLAASSTTLADVRVSVPEDTVQALGKRLVALQDALTTNQSKWAAVDRAAHEDLLHDIEGHLDTKRYYQAWRLLESELADRIKAPAGTERPEHFDLPTVDLSADRNLFPAGSFEVPQSGEEGKATTDDLKALGFALYAKGGANVEVRPAEGRNGSRCLAIDSPPKAYFTLSSEIAKDVPAGQDYALSFWVKGDRPRVAPVILSVTHGGGSRWRYRLALGVTSEWKPFRVVLSVPERLPGEPVASRSNLKLVLKTNSDRGTIFPTGLLIDDVALTCLGKDISD